jgi:ribonuclease HII
LLRVDEAERKRLQKLSLHERRGWKQGFRRIVGVDEAGRGPLAGPVVAAACALPKGWRLEGVDDSKRLTPDQRDHLYAQIVSDPTVRWATATIDHLRIDAINILRATHEAMAQAIDQIDPAPDLLLVDGLGYKHASIPVWSVVKGDSLVLAIAVASILAKVTRDRLMLAYDTLWPHYGFAQHKGYGTEAHRRALLQHGPCPIHRRTFLMGASPIEAGLSSG